MTTPAGLIPISLFRNVQTNVTQEFHEWSWDELTDNFHQASEIPLEAKQDAILFAPCEFQAGRRLKTQVLRSGLVVLDIDAGTDIDQAIADLTTLEIAALLCTTASHRPDQHKFRVLVPLADQVSGEEYPLVWSSINTALLANADSTKHGAESLFYLPASYLGCPDNRFATFPGHILTAEDWVDLVPPDRKYLPVPPTSLRPASRRRRDPGMDLSNIYECRLVSPAALREYLGLSGNWHHGRFVFMCSVAGRARQLGYPLSPWELVDLFNQLDRIDGGYYTGASAQRSLLKDAERALGFVGREAVR